MNPKWLLSGLLVVLVVLQYRLWVGEGSFAHWYNLKAQSEDQKQENDKLQDRNKKTELEIEALRSGLDGVEERAREEMGMIKEGETFFMVVEPDKEKGNED